LKSLGRDAIRLYMKSPFRAKSRIRSVTDRWLAPKGNIERVRVGPCLIDLDHRHQATRNMAYGIYEKEEIALLSRCLCPGDRAVDVGANVGYLSAHMARLVGPHGKVYSFEPGPTPFRSLQAVKASNLQNNMEIFQMAVADQEREATYYETDNILSKGYGRIDNRPSKRFQHVKSCQIAVTSLATFFIDRPVDRLRLIKIDVEGHEKQVIDGLTGLLDRNVRPLLIMETTVSPSGKADCLDYENILGRYGYKMFLIGKSLSKATPDDLKKSFHGNVVWSTHESGVDAG